MCIRDRYQRRVHGDKEKMQKTLNKHPGKKGAGFKKRKNAPAKPTISPKKRAIHKINKDITKSIHAHINEVINDRAMKAKIKVASSKQVSKKKQY
eukprot:TRINITY_DN7083_c0_g1_i6.p2 TRINITY_DN7083_c0_g1~~TRINITY_DN7083_c0_g1_i6.p2  ORF type:complete len:109 (+),score=31.39 TRINITY_DN7083_c0_g1_i6:44-328(+)